MDLPEDDDEPAIRYPVDDIMESTSCELHVKVMNITMKVAVGYALPIGLDSTYHCRPIPHGYAVAGVDEVMGAFEHLKLDNPAGEGDLYELGEAKKITVAVTQHTTACCSTQVIDITLMELNSTNITSLRVVQQKHCGSTYKLLLLQAK
jgi:hypothetical protein